MCERTLLIVKPDAVGKNLIGEILRRIEAKGFKIVGMKMHHLSKVEAETFYAVHKGRPFYEPLIQFMIEGPCVPVVVEGDNVIEGIRELNGTTDPAIADEGTIRKDFAENTRRNAVHASDSAESAAKEIEFFFPEYELI
ncbi:nucleoside-diphosphate kinase [candidate division KSB1 bacterium]|nr:nucleoside-diphosphate kinase [candidate division KSB1 bacterium]